PPEVVVFVVVFFADEPHATSAAVLTRTTHTVIARFAESFIGPSPSRRARSPLGGTRHSGAANSRYPRLVLLIPPGRRFLAGSPGRRVAPRGRCARCLTNFKERRIPCS